MYKKLLSVFLSLALLFALALPAGAEDGQGEILQIDGPPQAITTNANQQSKRPWDYIGEVSLIEPAPGMRDMAVQLPCIPYLFFLLRDNGDPDTWMCIELYQAGNPEPITVVNEPFAGVYGIYCIKILWDTTGFDVGSYRIVTYSATKSGEELIPIPETGTEVTILLTDWYKPLESISLVDPDTREEVTTLKLSIYETGYLELVDLPVYNTYMKGFQYNHQSSNVDLVNAGNLLIFTPTRLGWSHIEFRDASGDLMYELDVEVCINSGGHTNQQVVPIAPKEDVYEAVTLYCCPDCGRSIMKTEESYGAAMGRFVDVSSDQWYYEGIKSMVGRGLFNGVSTHHFRPDHLMTRAMLVTVLWRYAGAPEAGSAVFTDVPDGQWYSQAVNWAAEQGVVSGIGKGKFDPEGNVTREQMATILYRYAKLCNFDTELQADALDSFPDRDQASGYALEPLQWAVSNGIINGTKTGSKTLLDPRGFATRAQLAVILSRYIDKYDPDPAQYPIPNLDQALEHGTTDNPTWAFFPDGTLVLRGSSIPDFKENDGRLSRPWEHLTEQITRVVVQEGVETLGTNALAGLSSLTEVELPSTLRYIKNFAFAYCTALERIEISQGTRYLGYGLFEGCTALKEVIFPDSIYQKNFPYGFTFDGSGMFIGCTALESVTLPPAMGHIPSEMFRDCTALKEVHFGPGLSGVYEEAFVNCTALEQIIFPYTFFTVYDEAFIGCTSLRDMVFLNPFAVANTGYEDSEGNPSYSAPFGDREITTVYAFSVSQVAEIAQAEGYAFVPLESLIE